MKKLPIFFALLLLVACGGPPKEAIVANTIQTLLASMIEANITVLLDDSIDPLEAIPCKDGGFMTVADATFGTYDPGTGATTIGPATVNFNHCKIKVCEGHITTLHGDGLFTIQIDATVPAGSTTLSNVALVATSNDLNFSGELDGALSFSYSLTGDLTRNTFGGIIVGDGNPKEPLTYGGIIYTPSNIPDYADGC